MIELIENEIITAYPGLRDISQDRYTLHCSKAVEDELQKWFQKKIKDGTNFIMGADDILNGKPIFRNLYTPRVGHIAIIVDMEQGYKIEKL